MALKRNREAGEPLLDKPRILSAEPGALSQLAFFTARCCCWAPWGL